MELGRQENDHYFYLSEPEFEVVKKSVNKELPGSHTDWFIMGKAVAQLKPNVSLWRYWLRSAIKIDALAFYDQRTGANLVKDAKDVFADEAREKQLHTGKEEERGDDQRGPPGNVLAKGRKE